MFFGWCFVVVVFVAVGSGVDSPAGVFFRDVASAAVDGCCTTGPLLLAYVFSV